MKYIVKIVVITMSMLLVGCGEGGPVGNIYVAFMGMGINSLDVEGADTIDMIAFWVLDESVTVNDEVLEMTMLSSGSIDYSYTYYTYDADGYTLTLDDDGTYVGDTTESVEFTATPNAGGDASGFDDGTAGYDKVCVIMISCVIGVCADAMTCSDAGGGYSETCTIVDGAQVCATD